MKMRVYICLLFCSLLFVGCDGATCSEGCFNMQPGQTVEVTCVNPDTSIKMQTGSILKIWCE